MEMDLRVVELLSSKQCHDLISPVSAINNGVELIEDIGDSVLLEAMKLIKDSAEQASNKLKVFRLSYGKAGAEPNQPIENIQGISKNYFSSSKIELIWDEEITLSEMIDKAGSVKVLLNTFLICEEALAYGGTITLKRLDQEGTIDGEKDIGCLIEVSGKKAMLSEEHKNALSGETPIEDLTPRTVQAYVTGLFASQFCFDISYCNPQEEVLEIKITNQPNVNKKNEEDQGMQI